MKRPPAHLVAACSCCLIALLSAACSDDTEPSPGIEAGVPDSAAPDTGGVDSGAVDSVIKPDAASINWKAEFDHVFSETVVRPVDIKISATDWASLLQDWRTLRKRTYRKVDVAYGSDALKDVGVRLRGYGSLTQVEKKELPVKFPLKFNFNKYGQPRYRHVDKVNFTVNRDDTSLMRERLTARLLDKMSVHVPRTAYAKVTVSQIYAGIYTMTQQIDKTFLKERFGTKDNADDGNLYKCIPNNQGENICTLLWKSDKKSDYLSTQCPDGYAACGLVQKTNEADPLKTDYADLIAFIRLLNQTQESQFKVAIQANFEVDSYLKFLAVNACLVNMDSMAYGKPNNYYLYFSPSKKKWALLPYDFDMSYGGPNFATLATSPLPTKSYWGNNMLSGRILAVPEFYATYLSYIKQIATTWLTASQQGAWVTEFDTLLGSEIAADPNIKLADYQTAIGTKSKGILGFVAARRAFLLALP